LPPVEDDERRRERVPRLILGGVKVTTSHDHAQAVTNAIRAVLLKNGEVANITSGIVEH
jgi:ABC-type sulfate/molybdate transport systems ATPase subunit